MGAYRTVIGYNPQQFQTGSTEPTRYLILDTQEDRSITASATIAQQPLQDGDTMSDHMYRNPVTASISGTFAINGKNWDDDTYDFKQMGDRLTNIQEAFEEILNQGFLCRLTTIDEDDVNSRGGLSAQNVGGAKNRFKIRKNMALKDISWTERQNTVKFTFQFVEVIMVEAQEFEELTDEERMDLGLPRVSSPQGSSLGTLLADTEQLPEIIVKALYNAGYIDNDFMQWCAEAGMVVLGIVIAAVIIKVGLIVAAITATGAVLAAAGAIAAGGGTMAVLGAVAGATSAVFPVGTIVVAVVAVVAAIGVAIWSIFNAKKLREQQEKRKKAFKLVNGSGEQDAVRLRNLIDDIEVAINKVKTQLTIYSITGNYEQQVILNIAGEYYVINFVKNNTNGYGWMATVEDLDGNTIDTIQHAWAPVANFTDMNKNTNLWFKDKTKQFEVYLMNPSLSEEINGSQEEIDNTKQQLEGYTIWVSKGDIKVQIDKVMNAIDNAIQAEGFV